MIDLAVFESGDGGDLVLNSNDLETTDSLFNQVYLAWFGNVTAEFDEDAEDFPPGEERKYYWQNEIFMSENEDQKMSGRVERSLSSLSMSSQGVFDLERIASDDLDFLSVTADVSVTVTVTSVDRIEISAFLKEKETQNEVQFKFMWDATQNEIIEKIII